MFYYMIYYYTHQVKEVCGISEFQSSYHKSSYDGLLVLDLVSSGWFHDEQCHG